MVTSYRMNMLFSVMQGDDMKNPKSNLYKIFIKLHNLQCSSNKIHLNFTIAKTCLSV